jgi:anti-sigma factor RsiW
MMESGGEAEMSESPRSISDDELHAYVDNQLDLATHAAVDLYLDQHPDKARRVTAYQRQRAILRAAITDARPLPSKLSVGRIAERLERQRARWRIAAAAVLGIGLGGIGGWFFHAPMTSDRTMRAMALLEHEALAAHAVYSADPHHPIEIAAAEREHLGQWLSNRLNRAVAPPRLGVIGYQLLGGRLLAAERGIPAAMFMYEDLNGHRLSVVMYPMSPDLRASRFDMTQGATNGCGWLENGLGYAVVAGLPDDELDRIAEHIMSEAKPTS